MASDVSTIQSLKAVDAWIDVINANINGGVRTAFKASRLKFSGSNVDVSRTGNAASLPLQFPEPGLTTANTVIDFSQGAITASTENTHLAIQGRDFFVLADPRMISANGTLTAALPAGAAPYLLTRDGEFRTNQNGLLVSSNGWFLAATNGVTVRAVYNNLDTATAGAGLSAAVRLSDFLAQTMTTTTLAADGVTNLGANVGSVLRVSLGQQSLQYTSYGSTVFDFGYRQGGPMSFPSISIAFPPSSENTILSKSLEASNASMTQSVPELSLAQKLFSALTKVLQTKQTNVDGVLNLVR